jgi:hypothetical protein
MTGDVTIVVRLQPAVPKDTTPPTISVLRPSAGGSFTRNQEVSSSFTCRDEPGGSGLESCTATVDGTTVANGSTIPTSVSGSHLFIVIAKDLAGNTAKTTQQYVVWGGWAGPIATPPNINVLNAGASVPIVFSLPGYHGLNIFESGYPQMRPADCQTLNADPSKPAIPANSVAGLTYKASADQYTYVWKTDRTWGNTCGLLVLKFSATVSGYSGAEITFLFQFS